jgi:hypothetical protein
MLFCSFDIVFACGDGMCDSNFIIDLMLKLENK